MKFQKVEFRQLLGSVLEPARYINSELNSFQKEPSAAKINFCFAYPDIYEIGFSHLGIKILYSIINNYNDAMADRVFAPWLDFADKLRQNNLPLFALESEVPLKDFDIIGFTMQSELTYTNILYMLELAQIPIFSNKRSENDPLIIAGGPTVSNPEPAADFFDAILIGDGEEAIIDIKQTMLACRHKSRDEKLKKLGEIEGIYVPQFYQEEYLSKHKKVKIRKFTGMNNYAYYHKNQLVPWLKPTHNRYIAEIMRGCSRGCRFCHAGMFYRPVRERETEQVLDNLLQEVEDNGWMEVALTSLSSSDYTNIKPLLKKLYEKLSCSKTSISLPSLRVDSLDDDIIELLNLMKQRSMTIAPEAGSQRLRDIINKNISETDIMKSIKLALDNNWQQIKMYFMIGLPFEKFADIKAIVALVEKIVAYSNKKLRLNITLSPFIPKPFTPFQWAKMEPRDDLLEKIFYIKNSLKKYRFIKIKYHDVDNNLLETILSRGGREIGSLIYQAYKEGAKFDGWNEYADFSLWQQAAEKLGIDFERYRNGVELDAQLNWEHIDLGINKKFLKEEWNKAKNTAKTADCRNDKCTGCGICDNQNQPLYATKIEDIGLNIKSNPAKKVNKIYYKVFYEKKGKISFVGHLDTLRMIQKILRKTKLTLAYSQGYNIHPVLSLGPPLPVGVEGENEYFDFALAKEIGTNKIGDILKEAFPEQLRFKKVMKLTSKKMRAMDFFKYEKIRVKFPGQYKSDFQNKLKLFENKTEMMFVKPKKKKTKQVDLKNIIEAISCRDNQLEIIKRRTRANIFDILREIFGISRYQTANFRIIREKLLSEKDYDLL